MVPEQALQMQETASRAAEIGRNPRKRSFGSGATCSIPVVGNLQQTFAVSIHAHGCLGPIHPPLHCTPGSNAPRHDHPALSDCWTTASRRFPAGLSQIHHPDYSPSQVTSSCSFSVVGCRRHLRIPRRKWFLRTTGSHIYMDGHQCIFECLFLHTRRVPWLWLFEFMYVCVPVPHRQSLYILFVYPQVTNIALPFMIISPHHQVTYITSMLFFHVFISPNFSCFQVYTTCMYTVCFDSNNRIHKYWLQNKVIVDIPHPSGVGMHLL